MLFVCCMGGASGELGLIGPTKMCPLSALTISLSDSSFWFLKCVLTIC